MGKRTDIKQLPSLERLNELFAYDQETGALTWKTIPAGFNRAKVGDVAGTTKNGKHGYRVIGIDRVYYYAHRIIWKMVTTEDPADQIDHIDGDRLNNRWSNMRPVSNGPNIQNSKRRRDNKSGMKGVCWDGWHKRWAAYISVGKRQLKLGRFTDFDDAADAVRAARTELHGEFARIG